MCLLSPLPRAQAPVDTARMKPPFTSGECHFPEGQLEARPLVAEVNPCQEVSRRARRQLKELGEEGTGGWGVPGPSGSGAGDPRALTTVQTGHPGLDGRGLRVPTRVPWRPSGCHAARDAGQPPNVDPIMWTLWAVSTPR